MFLNEERLKDHMETQHGPLTDVLSQDDTFNILVECKNCDRMFVNEQRLNEHMEIEHEPQPRTRKRDLNQKKRRMDKSEHF